MQTNPAENLGDLDLAHRRAQHLEPIDDVANEVGESIHGFTNLDERVGSLVVEALHPGGNRRRSDEESASRLRQRPAASGPEFEDRHAFGRRVVGPPLSGDAVHPGVLDPCFFYKDSDLLPEAADLGFQPDSGVDAVGGDATGKRNREVGQRDRVDHAGSDAFGPTAGQGNAFGSLRNKHQRLQKRIVDRVPGGYDNRILVSGLEMGRTTPRIAGPPHRTNDAIAILELNAEEYPNAANVYDSLGDAYREAGDTKRAAESYTTALGLDADAGRTRQKLEEISNR